jgi:hypothetical protein
MRENITIFGLLSLANFTEDDVLQVLSVQGYIYLLAFFLKKKIQDAFAHLLGSYTTPLTFLLCCQACFLPHLPNDLRR